MKCQELVQKFPGKYMRLHQNPKNCSRLLVDILVCYIIPVKYLINLVKNRLIFLCVIFAKKYFYSSMLPKKQYPRAMFTPSNWEERGSEHVRYGL